MTDRIEKTVELHAPVERVWRALTDHAEFGRWFGVRVDAPFAEGETSTGHITHPGYEHVRWDAAIRRIEPMRLFAFAWHPYAVDPDIDYSGETPTLVEFRLEPKDGGTRLTIVESGFDGIPAQRRDEALRMNEGGWAAQAENIAKHLGG